MKLRLIALLALTLSANGSGAETLHIAAENSWPPFSDQRGKGISRRLVDAALQTQGISTRYSVVPYARVLHAIAVGDVDAGFNVTRQKTTEAQFLFGSRPLLQASASWYFRPDAAMQYHHFDDLPSGIKVGLIIDYEYGDEFELHRQNFSEFRVSSQQQLIKMLLHQRVDAIVLFDRVADYRLDSMGLPPDTLARGFQNHISDIYVAFNRDNPRSPEFAHKLDLGLEIIQNNGLYQILLMSP